MAVERFSLGDPDSAAVRVHSLAPGAESVTDAVRAIVDTVHDEGDEALRSYVERFDNVTGDPAVPSETLFGALEGLAPDVRRALEVLAANVRTVAEADLGSDVEVALPQGQTVRLRDGGNRGAGLLAFGQHLGLELCAMAPPRRSVGVHRCPPAES